MYIALNDINVDASINPRAGGLNDGYVAELAAWLNENPKADLPPVVVFGKDRLLSEGFHRCAAYADAGRKNIPCEIRDGDRTAAILNAAASNQKHGLKRTNEDKRLAVRLALEAAPGWTERKIAEHVGVVESFVSNLRASVSVEMFSENISDDDEPAEETPLEDPKPAKRGPKPKKADHAKAAARLLLKDHTRTDGDIADEIGCNGNTVALARRVLVAKGRIPEPKKAEQDEPTPSDPLEAFVGELQRLCRLTDALKKEVEKAVESHPLGKKFVHVESICNQLHAARSALWQARPSEKCNCVKNDKPAPTCKACHGCGRCPASRVLKGSK